MDLNQYSKTTWTPSMPITSEKMNNLETGVEVNRNAIIELDTDVNALLNSGFVTLAQVETKINEASSNMQAIASQINSATSIEFPTLGQRFEALENQDRLFKDTLGTTSDPNHPGQYIEVFSSTNTVSSAIDALSKALGVVNGTQAYNSANTVYGAVNPLTEEMTAARKDGVHNINYNTLALHLNAIHTRTDNLNSTVNSILGSTGMDDNNVLIPFATRMSLFISTYEEVMDAHRTGLPNDAEDSLVDRFTAIESRLNTTESNASTYVKYTDVKNDFSSSDTNKPLSALKGKELREMIGGSFSSGSTVSTAIDTAQSTAEANAEAYADLHKVDKTNIYNGLDYVPAANATDDKVLDARQGKALNDRLVTAETTLINALTSSVVRTPGVNDGDPDTDTTYASLDARLEAIEGHAATARTDINTIADELNMYTQATGAIAGTNSRIDQLETNMVTMANEIGMLQNGEAVVDMQSAITGANTRIDTIDADLNTATTGIKARLDAIDDSTTGALTTLDSRLDAIDGGTALTGTALASRVGTLETTVGTLSSKQTSYTEVVASLPTTNIDATKDYLVGPDSEGKYYYYKYINNSWELISGGSGNGGGDIIISNSAVIAALLPAAAEADINTDYYIGNTTDGYMHYRFITVHDNELDEDVKQAILIGQNIDTNNIKKYNIRFATVPVTNPQTNETTNENRLYLYEIPYGESNDFSLVDWDQPDAPEPFTYVVLPAGGGGGSAATDVQFKVRQRTSLNLVLPASTPEIILKLYYSSYIQDDDQYQLYNGTYTLKRGSTIIDSGDILAADPTLINTVINQETGELYSNKSFNVTRYCTANVTTNFALTISNGVTSHTYTWSVQLVDLSITATLDDQTVYPAGQKVTFSATPIGGSGTDKVVCVVVDGDTSNTITRNVRTSGDTVTMEIPAALMTEGPHLIKIYVKLIIGGNIDYSESEPIYKDIACVDDSVVITSTYRRGQNDTPNSIELYKTLAIPYYLYIPDNSAKTVTITQVYNNVTTTQTLSLTTGPQSYIFKANDVGSCTITITCEGTSIDLPFTITESQYIIEPISEGLVFDFNPFGYSNDSEGDAKFWKQNENIYLSIPEGEDFDWNNGGWKYDTENNAPYFCVKAGSRAQINYPLFYNGLENTGAEFKCIFKAVNVKDADAVFLTSLDKTESEIFNYDSDVITIADFKNYLNVKEGYVDVTDSGNNTTSTLVVVCPTSIDAEDFNLLLNTKRNEIAGQYDNTYTITTRTVTTDGFSNMTNTSEVASSGYSTIIYSVTKNNTTSEVTIEVETTLDANEVLHYGKINVVRPILNRTQVHRGLEMSAHAARIHTSSGTLFNPYSEEDIIEFEYNIHKKIANKSSSYIVAYEDGVCAAPLLYYPNKTNTTFALAQPGNLIIGSDDCDIYIYRIKFYNKELTNEQVLANFYADAIDSTEMVARYERNVALYKDPTNTDNIISTVTPQSVARACPDLKILMIEMPNLTGGKKSFIKNTKIRCIHKGGRPEDNWVALNAYHAGQGTTSDKYGDAGRNLDIMFGFNGIDSIIAEKSDNNYRFDNTYKSVLITGVTDTDNIIDTFDNYVDSVLAEMNDENNTSVTKEQALALNDFHSAEHTVYLNGTGKINLSATSVPNNWFNIKVNIASSENANNALLQKRYDKFLPYVTPARRRGHAENASLEIKNDMEFFNTVIFIREVGTPTEFPSDANTAAENRPWHFYGIGNLGDSKKTDDSRVNIPGDPNEFCVEISDNGLVNSGFNTGVYYTGVDENGNGTGSSYTATEYGIKYPVTSAEWLNENNTVHAELVNYASKKGWENSFEFRYDISTKDGNTIADSALAKALATARQTHNKEVFANMYQWVATATNAEFRSQLSNWFIEESPLYWYLFTERYTMIDNRAKNSFWHYGKVYITDDEYNGTNLTTLQAAISQAATDVEEAEAQTAYDVALYIYQNRDTFLHGLVLDGQGNVRIDYNELAQINNGYRFELWDYDNDTALGINNNGKLVFDYGLEDIDKTETGGWVFNQANSVFWRRIRENMYEELSSLYHDQLTTCWNADNLLTEFDEWQEQFPEELWRLDFERKYLRPYLTKGENKYLKDMANGRKKYQRRLFERNMAIYMCSKYVTGQSYDPTDFIEFRASQNQNINQSCKIGIKPYGKMYINIMIGNTRNAEPIRAVNPNEYVWINPKEIAADFYSMQTNIFNASRIQALEGLADMYIDTAKFSTATKLKKLVLGKEYLTDDNGDYILDGNNLPIPYVNRVTSELVLESNPILEELDVRNCYSLSRTLNLVYCINLKVLHAEKTAIESVNFADNGLLTHAYLPGSITSLEFNELKHLSTVNLASYQNLTSYINNNSPLVDSQTILNNAANLSIIKINGINWASFSNMELLADIYSKYQVVSDKTDISLAGIIALAPGTSYKSLELADYRAAWSPNLTINTENATEIKQLSVTFKYDSDTIAADNIPENEWVIYKYYVTADSEGNATLDYFDGTVWKGLDPITLGWLTGDKIPSRKLTDSSTYTFGSIPYTQFSGWTYNGSTPTMSTTFRNNITLYTKFNSERRSYRFRWFTKNAAGEDIQVKASDSIYYGENSLNSAPTVMEMVEENYPVLLTHNNSNIISIFKGWHHLPLQITPSNQDIQAVWQDYNLDTINFGTNINLSELSAGELYKLCNSEYLANVPVNSLMTIPLGYDGVETPAATIEKTELNAANEFYQPITSLRLFTQDKEFTLMVDYKFNIENSSLNNLGYNGQTPHRQSILLSCYQNNNGTIGGFKLYYDFYDGTSRISFGDDTNNNRNIVLTNHTNAHNRNIIVIRHPANSTTLYVSHGTNVNGLIDNVVEDTISIPIFTAFNTELVIGACLNTSNRPINDLPNRYMTYGNGVIYLMSIWNKDLGSGEAKALANWCHENMTFGVVLTTSTNSVLNIPNEKKNRYTPNMYLSSLSTSEMGTYTIAAASGDEEGWLNSTAYRLMLHNRVINALPIEFQSILHAITVKTNAAVYTQGFTQYYSVNSSNSRELDDQFVSIPSYVELAGVNSTYDNEALGKFPWISAANTTIKSYSSGSFSNVNGNTKYLNVRCQGLAINLKPKVYLLDIEDIAISAYNTITTSGNTLSNGDMWDNKGTVYVYANQTAADAGAPIIFATTEYNSKFACTYTDNDTGNLILVGGWIPATEWWTRSYVDNENIYQGSPNFVSVSKDGTLVQTMNTASYYVDYSIGF